MFVPDKASNIQHPTYELGMQMNLFTSPHPPLLPFFPSLRASLHPGIISVSFQPDACQAAVLFWVTVNDAQVTKAQRCTLPSVSSVLRQMLAEAKIPTQCLEQTALGGFIN